MAARQAHSKTGLCVSLQPESQSCQQKDPSDTAETDSDSVEQTQQATLAEIEFESWNELRGLVVHIYKNVKANKDKHLRDALSVSFEHTYNLVYKLCKYNPGKLYRKLEQEAQDHLETIRQKLLTQLSSCSHNKPHQAAKFLQILVDSFLDLSCANEIFNGVFIYLHSCFLKQFGVNFGDINLGLFWEIIWQDPLLNSNLPKLKAKLRRQIPHHLSLFREVCDLELALKRARKAWKSMKKQLILYEAEQAQEQRLRDECRQLQQRWQALELERENGTLNPHALSDLDPTSIAQHINSCPFCYQQHASPQPGDDQIQATSQLVSDSCQMLPCVIHGTAPHSDDACSHASYVDELYEEALGEPCYDSNCPMRHCPETARENLRKKLSMRLQQRERRLYEDETLTAEEQSGEVSNSPSSSPTTVRDDRSVDELLNFIHTNNTPESKVSDKKKEKRRARQRQRRKQKRRAKAGRTGNHSSLARPEASPSAASAASSSRGNNDETATNSKPAASTANATASEKLMQFSDFPSFWGDETNSLGDDPELDAEVEEFRRKLAAGFGAADTASETSRPAALKSAVSPPTVTLNQHAFSALRKACEKTLLQKKKGTG